VVHFLHHAEIKLRQPNVLEVVDLYQAAKEMFAGLKNAAESAPGPGKVILHLVKKGEYAVILEPEGMNVAADRGWIKRVEELVGEGTVRALGIRAMFGG
jgi:DNA polymerase-3 subunit alpha